MAIIDKKQKRWYSKSTFDSLDKTAIPIGTEIQVAGELGQSDFDTDTNAKLNDVANKLDKTGGTISGSLTITQDLIVNGTTSTVETQNLKVADKLIYVAKDNTIALISPAGLITPKYDGTNNGGIVYDSTGTAYVGDITLDSDGNVDVSNSDLQPIATRNTTITDGNIVKWDDTKKTLVDSGKSIDDLSTATNLKNGTADVLIQTTDTNHSFKVMTDGRAKVQSAPVEDDDVVRKKELNMKTSQEVFIGESLPTGTDARIWIDTGISTSELSKIYGVDKVGQENPTLTRTNDATGLTYAIGTSEITSDFDNCYPWSNMQEVTDSSGNVFIKIPKFYSKVTKNTDGTYKHQISGTQHEGFTTLFVDGKGNELDYILVGKYEGSGSATRVYSKSNATVLVNITRGNFRTACRANGAGYQQYDFLIDAIIKELFMIEFATTNSQSIMQGWTNGENTAALITGRTDAVLTPSGSPESNTDGKHACKYRGIENPFGNVWKWCDGINFDTEKIYVCEDPEHYADDKHDAPYTYMGDRVITDGYIKTVTPFAKQPLLGFVTKVDANPATYYCDYTWHNNGVSTALCYGGNWRTVAAAGLWSWSADITASYAFSNLGGRLCYKPL